jgi:integral membrane protein
VVRRELNPMPCGPEPGRFVRFSAGAPWPLSGADTVVTVPRPADPRALRRYRVLAYTTAVLLIVLVFVGVPLQIWGNDPWVARIVGTAHGYLYIVYLLVAFDFTRRLRVPLIRMVLVLLAGTIPFCAIVAERLLTRRFERAMAEARLAMAGAAGATGAADASGVVGRPG